MRNSLDSRLLTMQKTVGRAILLNELNQYGIKINYDDWFKY